MVDQIFTDTCKKVELRLTVTVDPNPILDSHRHGLFFFFLVFL